MSVELTELWRLRGFLRMMALHDLRRRFRRSEAGLFYLVLQPLAFALALGWVFGHIFHHPFVEFVPFVLCGTVIWEALTSACLAGGQSIIGAEGYVRHYRLPLMLHPLRAAAGVVVQAMAGLALVVAWTVLALGRSPSLSWLAVPAGFVLLAATAAALATASSIATARVRDCAPLMTMAFPLLWLMSPIGVPPGAFRDAGAGWLVDANPVYHLAEWLRAPLLRGEWPSARSIGMALALCAVSVALAAILVRQTGRRFVYWL
jgi:lipopolysaccharide transport system permease protein